MIPKKWISMMIKKEKMEDPRSRMNPIRYRGNDPKHRLIIKPIRDPVRCQGRIDRPGNAGRDTVGIIAVRIRNTLKC